MIREFNFGGSIDLLRNTQLEASAGTGKTYSIERIVSLLVAVHSIELPRILIVTFTRKAARELKDRMRTILTSAVREKSIDLGGTARPLNREELENAGKALHEFEKASILTIHSFCLNMLQAYPFESLSQFTMDMESVGDAAGEAVKDYMREIGESMDPRKLLQFRSWLSGRNYQSAVEDLADAVAGELFESAQEIIPDFKTRDEIPGEILEFNSGNGSLYKAWRKMTGSIPSQMYLEGLGFGHLNWFMPGLEKLRLVAGESDLLKIAGGISGGGILKTLERFLPRNLEKTLKKGTDKEAVLKDSFVRSVEDFLDLYFYDGSNPESDLYQLTLMTGFLVESYGKIRKRLGRKKEITGKLDFNDLIGKLHSAVCGNSDQVRPELIKEIRKRYRTVLIDEFQDTDSRQWEIFHTLFGEDDRHNLFLVGDPKQSIYRFRGADLEVYHRACGDPSIDGRYTLARNFRSVPPLVEGVNGIFSRVFSPEMHCGETGRTPFHPVQAGKSHEPRLADGRNTIEFLMIESTLNDNGQSPLKASREQYFRLIAYKAYTLLKGKTLLGENPVRPGDMAVLTENNRDCRIVQQLLTDYAIPSVINARERIFDTVEADDFLLLLQALVRQNSSSLKLLLLSGFFRCTPAAVEAMERDGSLDGLSAALLRWREETDRGKLIEITGEILDLGGFERRVLALKNGERSYSNMRQLLEFLHGEQQRGRLNAEELHSLLLSRIKGKSGIDEDLIRLDKDSEAVQIMTIHASKGLEFPVVFFAGAITKDYRSGRSDYFDFVRNGKRYYDFFKEDGSRRLAAMDQWEERKRLYYVALTRSSSKLYMPFIPALELSFLSSLYSAFAMEEIEGLVGSSDAFEPFTMPLHNGLKLMAGKKDRENIRGSVSHALDRGVFRLIESGEGLYSLDGDLEKEYLNLENRGALVYRESDEEPELICHTLKNDRGFDDRYSKVSSFTALARHGGGDADHDNVITHERQASSDNGLTRGAVFGELVHKIFEELDYSFVERESLEDFTALEEVDQLFKSLAVRFFDNRWYGRYSRQLKEVIYRTLKAPVMGDFSLCKLTREDRLHEVEFHMTVGDCENLRLGEGFAGTVEKGYLKGFIDIIFRYGGKYYIADWKTTSSPEGDGPEAYREEILGEMMKTHHYNLQSIIYSMALYRYLRSGEFEDFDYERDFGGCYYFFVRGVGVHFSRPSEEELLAFAAQFTEKGGLS